MHALLACVCLSGCGGSAPSEEAAPAARVEAPMAAEVKASARPEDRIDPVAVVETPTHSCVRKLHASLKAALPNQKVDVACLAGHYVGSTIKGGSCALRIGASSERSELSRQGDAIDIELRSGASRAKASPADVIVEPTDVEPGHIGLRIRRPATSASLVDETIVLSAGPREDGAMAALNQMTYERVDKGDVLIMRCAFES
jgi:hypothetical protein